MNFSHIFIRRPVATTLLTLAIALSGGLAYFFLPVAPMPQIDFPTISVQASLPGASPDTMASAVTTPLERQFGSISGISEMTSVSSQNQASITLQFDLSRNVDAAARDVQAKINGALSNLPANLPSRPTYRKVNPADAPIMIIALTSDLYSRGQMYDVANSILMQKLSQVEGVGQVTIGGSTLPAVRVEVNPAALNNLGLGFEDVRTALSTANANRPKGRLSDGVRTWTLEANDQMLDAVDYLPLIVSYRNGAPVRLSDVATATNSVEDVRQGGLANGKPAVSLVIFRQPNGNIIETVDRILAMVPRLRASIPPVIHLDVTMDRTPTIRSSIKDIQITLLFSIFLVILVVFAFLRSLRATLIPAVAVPVSLIGTFGVMYLAGYSIDNLSLMALTISTGFVVDDAIVVLENITRYREQGMSRMAAALRGAREIGFTVLSMSTSLVAVFIPILFMGGLVGRLFREFAVTLSVAIGVSLVISLTTTPMMCALVLPDSKHEKHGRIYRLSEWIFDSVLGIYEKMLRWVMRREEPVQPQKSRQLLTRGRFSIAKIIAYSTGFAWIVVTILSFKWVYDIYKKCRRNHQFLMLLVTVATVFFTIYLYYIVPKGFLPQQDTGRLAGSLIADQSNSFYETNRLMEQFASIASKDPAVAANAAFTSGSNGGRMFVSLKPQDERKGMTSDEVVGRLRGKMSKIAGGALFFTNSQDVRVGGRSSSAQYQYTLEGDNFAELSKWAPKMLDAIHDLPGIVDANSDQQSKGLEANLTIDRDAATRLGITPLTVDTTLNDAFGQRQVSTLFTRLNQYHVIMEMDPAFAKDLDSFRHVYFNTGAAHVTPLRSITSHDVKTLPLSITHHGQFPSITLSFNLTPNFSLGTAIDEILDAGRKIRLPASIHGFFAGTAQAFQSSLSTVPVLLLAALFAVYIVLGILYESYIHPITIISTLPSAGVGALLAVILTGTDLNLIGDIGIILLIGIVKKNAIMMIDVALIAEREEGMTPEQAIFHACLLRFRPIMMTTMAALFGGLPLALGTGVGYELRQPLGITIVGGLIFSQALTLFTTPVIYLYMERLRLWTRKLFGRPPPHPLAKISPA